MLCVGRITMQLLVRKRKRKDKSLFSSWSHDPVEAMASRHGNYPRETGFVDEASIEGFLPLFLPHHN